MHTAARYDVPVLYRSVARETPSALAIAVTLSPFERRTQATASLSASITAGRPPVRRRAVAAVEARAPRVSVVLKADIRPGVTDGLTSKVDTVERHLSA